MLEVLEVHNLFAYIMEIMDYGDEDVRGRMRLSQWQEPDTDIMPSCPGLHQPASVLLIPY